MGTFEMLDIIVKIILVGIFGGICALFSYFLDYCFWDGSIFGKYLPWLSRTMLKWNYPNDYKEVLMLKKEHQLVEFMGRAEKVFFYKILGGCVICTNVWICFASYAFIAIATEISWWYLIVYITASSYFIRKLMKI